MFDTFFRKVVNVTEAEALPGRAEPLPGIPETNIVLGTSMHPPIAEGIEVVIVRPSTAFWNRRIRPALRMNSTSVGRSGA